MCLFLYVRISFVLYVCVLYCVRYFSIGLCLVRYVFSSFVMHLFIPCVCFVMSLVRYFRHSLCRY